jgi:hypothetical protein
MRIHTEQCRQVLTQSFDRRWLADLYYDGVRRLADLPISDPSFSDDGDSQVQQTGTVTVTYSGNFAETIVPKTAADYLAPFGAELAIYVLITAGPFVERIPMGWYRITEPTDSYEASAVFQGRRIVVGSTVKLALQDRLVRVQRDRFDLPSSPPQQESVLTEIGRLTGLQITRQVDDRPIPTGVAYEEDRLEAVYDLADVLDAVPHPLPDGSLGQRPNVWPEPVDTLRRGNGGTLVSVGRSMSADRVYNRVAVRSASTDQRVILATAEVTEGPLRASNADGTVSPFGRATYFYSSEKITTIEQAEAYAQQQAPRVSSLRAVEVPVVEKFNPLREVGDVLVVERDDPSETFVGRVKSIDRDSGATQKLTMEVS